MRFEDDVFLSLPEDREADALHAPLTLDRASTFENSALAVTLAMEGAAKYFIGPTVESLARSPLWRLMCEELLAAREDPDALRMAFLLASARLYSAGSEAERCSD